MIKNILFPRGKQLLELYIMLTSGHQARIIAANCAQLRKLKLRFDFFSTRKVIEDNVPQVLELILSAFGSKLHKLEIICGLRKTETSAIRTNCTALRMLNLKGTCKISDEHAASYGRDPQAYVPSNFTEDNIYKVVSSWLSRRGIRVCIMKRTYLSG